jgi:hypothetical protein
MWSDPQMNAYAPPHNPQDSFSRRLEEMMASLEVEVRHAVAYVDAEIVPQVRREAGILARVLSGHLDRLAERLHPQADPGGRQG